MENKLVNIEIDGESIEVEAETSILDAAKILNKDIPTLCYLEEKNLIGACRICLVEIENSGKLAASCITPVSEGLKIKTNSSRIRRNRKMNLEFLLSNHNIECPSCISNESCELREIAEEFGVREVRFEGKKSSYQIDQSTPSIFRDPEKCILCRRCESVCRDIQSVEAVQVFGRGFETVIKPSFYENLADSPCVLCGQCTLVCPTGALREKEYIEEVWQALDDPEKHVVVQTAPAVRVSLSEAFSGKSGEICTEKMVTALKKLGFDKVFDTNFAADLTIVEEANEFVERINQGGKLPLFTSCSPGWINFIEEYYPEYLDNLSSCKSPQQMFGALAHSYYLDNTEVEEKDLIVVSIMPCTAKKFEAQREEMAGDVDYVLTTRELAQMIKEAGFKFENLEDSNFDQLMGESTGAGAIFGTTGGVMEAALRTAYEKITGKELEEIDINGVRGFDEIKKITVNIDGLEVKAAVAHGLSNARKVFEMIKKGEKFHFIEFMACPGGCLGGGGQPLAADKEVLKNRMKAIYEIDTNKKLRKSHENPYIIKLYKEYLENPGSEIAHKLLHTKYKVRKI
ncbi:NAD(P)-dependent iron-only hydrogenase catalytic subunit [Halanaerobium congolense]|uniref:NAD(P)-dependent iron-only hydrogenase catalytic subunit n=1 Tax=Halanaerobium congolense TaxID=54121 RepID=A0A1I0CCG7_9FIRM|nr:NADH-dependent [FeFe] hydrogenase, group A6 [Halanaerobium congolense]PTX17945.1 NAD(P)-dependent iron-only hydrogenase catalytic subunit [Halanaerobium congolense]SDF98684.1 NAD(P)-dependent iron-only hydrogenase catalytic subunit [Halanaerobium congolense]SET17247.1 NAD(P)-dependent iron-only hydrogenase catalytic subunit [Halanaerobium congolense]SFP65121.1 NAD(P)-dependent iron-only hydrogenase catalytic subunit [Halanaerobium congolense]